MRVTYFLFLSRDRHAAYEYALRITGCYSECVGAERGAEYRYVMGHVEAQMYSSVFVLDYTWLLIEDRSKDTMTG